MGVSDWLSLLRRRGRCHGLINSLGNLGGFVGPYLVGWLRETSGSFAAGLILLSLACLVTAGIALLARFEPGEQRSQGS